MIHERWTGSTYKWIKLNSHLAVGASKQNISFFHSRINAERLPQKPIENGFQPFEIMIDTRNIKHWNAPHFTRIRVAHRCYSHRNFKLSGTKTIHKYHSTNYEILTTESFPLNSILTFSGPIKMLNFIHPPVWIDPPINCIIFVDNDFYLLFRVWCTFFRRRFVFLYPNCMLYPLVCCTSSC